MVSRFVSLNSHSTTTKLSYSSEVQSQVILPSLVLGHLLSKTSRATSGHCSDKTKKRSDSVVWVVFNWHHSLLFTRWVIQGAPKQSFFFWNVKVYVCQLWDECHPFISDVQVCDREWGKQVDTVFGMVRGSACLQSLHIKTVFGIFLNNFTEKWLS